MRFKVDENLPVEVAEVLRQSGHDAVTVLEQQHGGSADVRLATLCQRESRALVTLDAVGQAESGASQIAVRVELDERRGPRELVVHLRLLLAFYSLRITL